LSSSGRESRVWPLGVGEMANVFVEQTRRRRQRPRTFDCIVIGGGIRASPERLMLFEKIINVVHMLAPADSRAQAPHRQNMQKNSTPKSRPGDFDPQGRRQPCRGRTVSLLPKIRRVTPRKSRKFGQKLNPPHDKYLSYISYLVAG
jgi:hypothetical protein